MYHAKQQTKHTLGLSYIYTYRWNEGGNIYIYIEIYMLSHPGMNPDMDHDSENSGIDPDKYPNVTQYPETTQPDLLTTQGSVRKAFIAIQGRWNDRGCRRGGFYCH
jgi:hypothetical protein